MAGRKRRTWLPVHNVRHIRLQLMHRHVIHCRVDNERMQPCRGHKLREHLDAKRLVALEQQRVQWRAGNFRIAGAASVQVQHIGAELHDRLLHVSISRLHQLLDLQQAWQLETGTPWRPARRHSSMIAHRISHGWHVWCTGRACSARLRPSDRGATLPNLTSKLVRADGVYSGRALRAPKRIAIPDQRRLVRQLEATKRT